MANERIFVTPIEDIADFLQVIFTFLKLNLNLTLSLDSSV